MDPFYKDADDTYRVYQKCLKRDEPEKAYRCLERLLKRYPDDLDLLDEMIALAASRLCDPKMLRPWLRRRIKLISHWYDYVLLSRLEAESGKLEEAKSYLDRAARLQKQQRLLTDSPREAREALERAASFIRLQGHNQWVMRVSSRTEGTPAAEKRKKQGPLKPARRDASALEAKEAGNGKNDLGQPASPASPLPSYPIPIRFSPPDISAMSAIFENPGTLSECRLRVDYARLEIQSGFDDLLCLNAIQGVERHWHQIETAKKALKYFHGRALLCDEVGLGKTIETGILMKEYLLRGMVKNILVLAPAPLVSQWQEEMARKFDIPFVTTEDPLLNADPDRFWKERFIIASIHTAKGSKHFGRVAANFYDLVVVDEAHHLKNRSTLNWKLVNEIKKRFIFLLTATPVQNNLIELFNLITLLQPGQFKTERLFRKEYVQRGDARAPANKERLRELLRDVMIRNTRSAIDLKLPRRFAVTRRVEPSAAERELYEGITGFVRAHARSLSGAALQLLMREAGSSPAALQATLARMRSDHPEPLGRLLDLIDAIGESGREKALLQILMKNPEEKKVVFTQYLKSLRSIASLLERRGLPFAVFSGDLTAREKDEAVQRFREDIPILLCTESGGEGRNLQFCNTLINFDLPWNPMRIEQRVGRLHRIGQSRDVFIFNLSVRETVEDHILDILENKINMFEMVIGEIEPILGYLGEEREFEEVVMEIWLQSSGRDDARSRFEVLGQDLAQARSSYVRSKELDREIFGEDYEV